MRNTSLKRRLLLLALTTVAMVWGIAAAIVYIDAREEFDEVLDAHLAQEAALLAVQASHELDELETGHTPLLHKYARRVAFQIWERGTQLRLHSANAPQVHLSEQEKGFSDGVINGKRWRVFSAWDESGEFLIQVAERADVREELAEDIAGNLLKPLLFGLPVLALLLWMAVTRGLRPLDRLALEVGRRDAETLTALDLSAAPYEVQPLIQRLNHLFQRIGETFQRERRFTADAAHELRTPMAGIKAQVQVARNAVNEPERVHALDNAILGCDRATRLIEQLLMLARVDALDGGAMEVCPLREMAAGVIAVIAPSALSRGVRIELCEGDEQVVAGRSELLQVMLRNLVDNAVRHTPEGTSVRVNVTLEGNAVSLSVCDDGPGLPPQELSRLSERFYRPSGTGAEGSGLGLSIVKRIAELHDATLRFAPADGGSGLCAMVEFRNGA